MIQASILKKTIQQIAEKQKQADIKPTVRVVFNNGLTITRLKS